MIEKGHLIIKTSTGRVVFKPLEFFDVGYNTIPYNEVAAYNIARFFGFDIVPRTEIKELAPKMGKEVVFLTGSCQEYVDAVPLNHYAGNINKNYVTEIIVLDTLLGNTDRKVENVLIGKNGNVYAIDNGFSLAFHLPSEADKRETDTAYDISLWDIDNPKIGIDNRLLLLVNQDYLSGLIEVVQDNISELNTENWYGGQVGIESEILRVLRYRAKYLPTLVWKQFRG